MHGLKCSPEIAGWTRLLDEWVVGLNHYAGQSVFGDSELFRASVARAATRVRTFAWGAEAVKPTLVEPGGVLRFDLQGIDYCVATHAHRVPSETALRGGAEGWLDAAAKASRDALCADEPDTGADVRSVGLLLVTAAAGGDRQAYRDVIRALPSTGSAWSFPSPDLGPQYDYAGDALGGVLLARPG